MVSKCVPCYPLWSKVIAGRIAQIFPQLALCWSTMENTDFDVEVSEEEVNTATGATHRSVALHITVQFSITLQCITVCSALQYCTVQYAVHC